VIRAVLVSTTDLARELEGTVLYRHNVERQSASDAAEVRRMADGTRIDVVVVDSAMAGASALVSVLRQDPATRATAIVALGRADFDFSHVALLEAGANAILPLPPGPDWDDRLTRLIHVPARRETRFPVDLAIDGGRRGGLRFDARAVNLSVHGILLECGEALDVGDDLRLAFSLPDGHGDVRATGTVVRTASPERFGVEITSVEADGRLRIKRYVESGPAA
jgi:DNA-binding response OmpR family regulator